LEGTYDHHQSNCLTKKLKLIIALLLFTFPTNTISSPAASSNSDSHSSHLVHLFFPASVQPGDRSHRISSDEDNSG